MIQITIVVNESPITVKPQLISDGTFSMGNIDHTVIQNRGTTTHAEIDTALPLKVEGIYTIFNWGDSSSNIRGYFEYDSGTDTVKLLRKVGEVFEEFGELGSSISADNFVANVLGSGLLFQTSTGTRKNLLTSQFDMSALLGNELGASIFTGSELNVYTIGAAQDPFIGNPAVDKTPTATSATAFGKNVYKYEFDFVAPINYVLTHVYVTTDASTPLGTLMIAAYNKSLSGDEDQPLSSNVPVSDFFADSPQGESISGGSSLEYKIKLTEDFNVIADQPMLVKFWSTSPLVYLGGDVNVSGVGVQVHPKYDFALTEMNDPIDLLKKLGGTLENVLTANSFSDQNPSGTDNPLQIEFGAAQGTVSDSVQIDALGEVTFNEAMVAFINIDAEYGRTGAAGESELRFRAVVNGVGISPTLSAKVTNSDIRIPLVASFNYTASIGDTVSFQLLRDSAGNDSGGLLSSTTTLAGWEDSPSARIVINRFID